MIDPRGPRFAAAITSVVLAVALLTGNVWVLAVQVAVFAIGAGWGVAASPYGLVYRKLVRPRLGPPGELEDARPPRFHDRHLHGVFYGAQTTRSFRYSRCATRS